MLLDIDKNAKEPFLDAEKTELVQKLLAKKAAVETDFQYEAISEECLGLRNRLVNKHRNATDIMSRMLEPIEAYEKRYVYIKTRANLTVLKTLGQLRARIGFYAVYNLFDAFELERISAQQDRDNRLKADHKRKYA